MIVIFGKKYPEGYLEYFAIVIDPNGLRYVSQGQVRSEDNVKHINDIAPDDDYWRETEPADFTDQRPVSGQIVWVSYAREEQNSDIYQGIVVGSSEAFGNLNTPLKTAFGRRTRTLLPQSQAGPCDSFWAVEEPAPVYCDD